MQSIYLSQVRVGIFFCAIYQLSSWSLGSCSLISLIGFNRCLVYRDLSDFIPPFLQLFCLRRLANEFSPLCLFFITRLAFFASHNAHWDHEFIASKDFSSNHSSVFRFRAQLVYLWGCQLNDLAFLEFF